MALNRQQRHLLANKARYQAGRKKPPTRRQVAVWLSPIRKAFSELKQDSVDSIRGYPVTRLNADDEYARIDFCITGFLGMINRLMPDFDARQLEALGKKLANGIPLTVEEIDGCFALLNKCETMMLSHSREKLIDTSTAEQVAIELDRIGLREAA